MPALRSTLLRLVALSLTGLALVLGPDPAQAAFPGSDGALVYGDDDGIVRATVAADGETLVERRLTNGAERNPRWLADGRRIVFNDRAGRVWVLPGSGGERDLVVGERAYQPAPSPPLGRTGVRIAFVRVPRGGVGDIWTVGLSGADPVRMTRSAPDSCGASWPTWSPDGRYLAWLRHQGQLGDGCAVTRIVVLDRGTQRRTVLGSARDPATGLDIVPDKGRITFTSDGAALVFRALRQSCASVWGSHDLQTQITVGMFFYECEGDAQVRQVVPEPGGGLARSESLPAEEGGSSHCLSWSGGRSCRTDDDERPPFPFEGFDVQPVR